MYSIVSTFLFDDLSNINILSQVLYNYYTSHFLLSSLVLLVAMIRVISLRLNFKSNYKTEIWYKQLVCSENAVTFFEQVCFFNF